MYYDATNYSDKFLNNFSYSYIEKIYKADNIYKKYKGGNFLSIRY
jgi:hypothetical protein